jgi:hypothetical protein
MDNILAHILTTTDAKPTGPEKWLGHCLAHGSKRHRDLSIRYTSERILLHCFAGCPIDVICQALKIEKRNLFNDAPTLRRHQPISMPVKVNRIALAWRFDLASLDLRLRAERIIEAGKHLDLASLNDSELDRAMNAVASAHADEARAELFVDIADDLRMKAWKEREDEQLRRTA